MDSYMTAWKVGIKAFAIYRDGSKAAQPLMSSSGKGGSVAKEQRLPLSPTKRRLPPTRSSETHKFSIAGHEGYFTYSTFSDGTLAEIFITLSKHGSTLQGLLGSFAISVSIALQYGVPLKVLASKYIYGRYEPAGVTENPDIPIAYSITDYIFRYLAKRFLENGDLFELGIADYDAEGVAHAVSPPVIQAATIETEPASRAPQTKMVFADTVCRMCGGMMVQTGSCKTCLQCGQSSGGCV